MVLDAIDLFSYNGMSLIFTKFSVWKKGTGNVRLGGSLVYVLVASASRYFFNSDYGIVASFLNQ